MSETRDLKLMVIRETWAEHILRDLTTFATLAALCGLGVIVGSTAMEWLGAGLGFVLLLSRAVRVKERHTFTVEEARAYLDAWGKDND